MSIEQQINIAVARADLFITSVMPIIVDVIKVILAGIIAYFIVQILFSIAGISLSVYESRPDKRKRRVKCGKSKDRHDKDSR